MEPTPLHGQLASLPGRYARTLFELAVAEHKQTIIQTNLDHFHRLYETVNEVKAVFDNPTLHSQERVEILQSIATHYSYDNLFTKFLCLLSENRRLSLFASIREVFIILRHATENIQDIEIISAVKLKKDQQQKLQHILAHRFTSQLNFNYQVNPQVLGGLQIKIGSHIVDLTVRNQMNMLANAMKGSA